MDRSSSRAAAVASSLTVPLLAAFALSAMPTVANAKVTIRVQQSDGSVQTYDSVTAKLVHQALYLTTADGKGTLIITKAACSYLGEIQRCLPYAATLVQNGVVSPLDFQSGTAYYNPTEQTQDLPLSSVRIPHRGLVMAFQTKRGTYVSVTGTLDKVTK
jgi:hypothetical protein